MMTPPETRVRRRAVACARCRLKKIVCDAGFPCCSKCAAAGAACVAWNSSRQGTTPRSIAQFLENELRNTGRTSQTSCSTTGVSLKESNGTGSLSSSIAMVDHVIKGFTPPFLGLTAATPLVRCCVAGTRLPSTSLSGTTDFSEHHARVTLDSPSSGTRLASIPVTVADFLFENYMKRVIAQYPIFYSSDVVRFFNSVFHHPTPGSEPGTLATSYEIYVVSLIMAISLTTSARTQQVHANSIAVSLFNTAMQQIHAVCTNDLMGLQAILLLLEYTFLNPSVANVWFLSGFTTQICIDLGLHQETREDLKADPLTVDIRRRVFWCAYEMEIATSGALLRPTSLLSRHINVPFPSEIEDSAISTAGIDPNGRLTKFPSTRIWKFRQIEAEIVSVLFHDGEIPSQDGASLQSWMKRMEAMIDSWRDEVHWSAALNDSDPAWEEMCLYANIAHDYIIVTLFRPSPRMKEPTCEDLMKAFIAGVAVAEGYWTQSNLDFGSSKYVFHPCYHTFSGAVVVLQTLERCKESIYLTYTLDQVDDFISRFSRFFATIAERWPAASRCLEEFERLMAPVKRKYIDFAVNKARAATNELPADRSLVEYHDETMDSAWRLDNMMGFYSMFPHELSNTEESLELPFTLPSDWNVEFDFGMS